MRTQTKLRKRIIGAGLLLVTSAVFSVAQDLEYRLDPEQTSVKFTLGDVLHTVRGTFKVKQGQLQMEPDGKVSGQILVDATSGNSGSAMRDRKMHKEVLESGRFPEISFRPDRIEGSVANSGQSSVMISIAGPGGNSLSFGAVVSAARQKVLVLLGLSARPVDHHSINPVTLLHSKSYWEFRLRKIA